MLRALSTCISQHKYDKIVDEYSSVNLLAGGRRKLTRSRTLPVQVLGGGSASSYNLSLKLNLPALPTAKKPSSNSKSHPLFSIFSSRRRKRTTSRPEFARYIQYVKEGGQWDNNSAAPVIYFN